jgi:DnaJ-class molecular chaperone
MELKREDLVRNCETCDGNGEVTGSSGSVMSGRAGSQVTFRHTCDACDGKGFTLTPAGKVLAQFIREVR